MVRNFKQEVDAAGRRLALAYDSPGYAYNRGDHWSVGGMGKHKRTKKTRNSLELEYDYRARGGPGCRRARGGAWYDIRVHLPFTMKGSDMKKLMLLGCVLLVLIPGLAIAGCGDSGGGGGTSQGAEQAAKTFFKAYQDKDAGTTWDLLASNSRKEVKKADWEKYLKSADDVKFSVGKVTVNGDKATATVTATLAGESGTEDVPLVKEGGAWKVDMAGIETE